MTPAPRCGSSIILALKLTTGVVVIGRARLRTSLLAAYVRNTAPTVAHHGFFGCVHSTCHAPALPPPAPPPVLTRFLDARILSPRHWHTSTLWFHLPTPVYARSTFTTTTQLRCWILDYFWIPPTHRTTGFLHRFYTRSCLVAIATPLRCLACSSRHWLPLLHRRHHTFGRAARVTHRHAPSRPPPRSTLLDVALPVGLQRHRLPGLTGSTTDTLPAAFLLHHALPAFLGSASNTASLPHTPDYLFHTFT